MTVVEKERADAAAVVADVIDRDLPCVRCTYNLRGLPAGGRCPECGQEVLLAIHGLAGAAALGGGQAWLTAMARGCRVTAMCHFTFWLLVAALVFVGRASIMAGAFFAAWAYIHLQGFWWITRPRPAEWTAPGETTARWLVRFAAVAAAGLAVLPIGVAAAGRALPRVELVWGSALLCYLVAYGGCMGYLRRLAEQMRNARLSFAARMCVWAMSIGNGLTILAGWKFGRTYAIALLPLGMMAMLVTQLAALTAVDFADAFRNAARIAGSTRSATEGTEGRSRS